MTDNSYIDEFLDGCFAYGFEGGPVFNTQIIELQNGREKRNAMWAEHKHKYNGSFLNIKTEQYRKIKQMHLVARGRLKAFKIIDPLDNFAVNQNFAQGNGVNNKFQLSTTSSIAGVSYTRGVYGIIANNNFKILVNNILVDNYTVDTKRGTITFNNPPEEGSILTWSGNFFIWVRFEQDDLPFTLDNPNLTNGAVTLIEVPPPRED